MRKLVLLIALFLFSFESDGSLRSDLADKIRQDHVIQNASYKTARQWLFGHLHLRENNTLIDVYCNIEFTRADGVGERKIPNPNVVNCEHTWPRSKFNSRHTYNAQLTDLHHLFPTQSRANSIRSNYAFSDVHGGEIDNCITSSIGKNADGKKVFEPAKEHKGNVARAMFYFSIHYDLPIDPIQEFYLREWHKIDPVDEHEYWRNSEIANIQGNRNPFIDEPQLVNRIQDF